MITLHLEPIKLGYWDLRLLKLGYWHIGPLKLGYLGYQDPPYTPLYIVAAHQWGLSGLRDLTG